MKRLAKIAMVSLSILVSVVFGNTAKADGGGGGEEEIARTGDLWILSIGINDYGNIKYDNCESDAIRFSQFFKERYKSGLDSLSKFKIHEYLLLGNNATIRGILNSLQNIIDSTKPNDYFIFNFAGTTVAIEERKGEIFFLPIGINNVRSKGEAVAEGISLKTLGKLFTLIPANNQLFFTEAGPTPEFRKEFINVVIEKNAIAAMLSLKKRIVMVPKNLGLDFLSCNGRNIQQGPLNYYLTQIPKTIDVFGLFGSRARADAVVFALQTNEVSCRNKNPYIEVFFERDYLEHVHQLLNQDQPLKRGGRASESEVPEQQEKRPGRKIALIVATDTFNSTRQWGKLSNPLNDAKAIGDTLKNQYGYQVEYLLNKSMKEITDRFLSIPKELKEDDQLIVYFAGHGDTSYTQDDGYIVCKDSKSTDDDPGRMSYIGFNKLALSINRYPPKQILVLLDVCFGGSFAERISKQTLPDVKINRNESFLSQKLRLQTRKYISAGGMIEVDDRDRNLQKHSPFAVLVLELLRTKGGSSNLLTGHYIYSFIQPKLPTSPLFDDFGDTNTGSDYCLVANTYNNKN